MAGFDPVVRMSMCQIGMTSAHIFVVSSLESTPYSFLVEDFTLAMKVPSGRPKATARLPFSCLNLMRVSR